MRVCACGEEGAQEKKEGGGRDDGRNGKSNEARGSSEGKRAGGGSYLKL